MISRHHLGAHVPAHVAALEADEIDEWIASGVVSLVTLAPELPGALDVTRRLATAGVVVSGGHTAMTPDDLAAACDVGLSYSTHLFNAMAPFNHRSPGPIGAVLAHDTLVAGLICDGIHVDPIAVRMAWHALGPMRMSLVSDASPALGMPYGRMQLAGFEIIHDETGVRTVDGVLAGSALALDQAVRNLMAFAGCDLARRAGHGHVDARRPARTHRPRPTPCRRPCRPDDPRPRRRSRRDVRRRHPRPRPPLTIRFSVSANARSSTLWLTLMLERRRGALQAAA